MTEDSRPNVLRGRPCGILKSPRWLLSWSSLRGIVVDAESSMGNVKEILRRTPPPILYHYTTQQGLLGIISDKEIWASHTQYLNDVREFRHALDLVKEEISAMKSEAATNELSRKCLTAMEESVLSGLESINVCVCSFSERGDVLSQWRAYGGATL